MTQMFTAQDADGDSAVVTHNGGEIEAIVSGDFGGGTLTLSANYNGVGYVPLFEGTWTEPSIKILRTVRPCLLRFTLSGATAPALDAWI